MSDAGLNPELNVGDEFYANPDLKVGDEFYVDLDELSHGSGITYTLVHYRVVAREQFGLATDTDDGMTMLRLVLSAHVSDVSDLVLGDFENPVQEFVKCERFGWEQFNFQGQPKERDEMVPGTEILLRSGGSWYFTINCIGVTFTTKEIFFVNMQRGIDASKENLRSGLKNAEEGGYPGRTLDPKAIAEDIAELDEDFEGFSPDNLVGWIKEWQEEATKERQA